MELVDTPDLGSGAFGRESSSLFSGTLKASDYSGAFFIGTSLFLLCPSVFNQEVIEKQSNSFCSIPVVNLIEITILRGTIVAQKIAVL